MPIGVAGGIAAASAAAQLGMALSNSGGSSNPYQNTGYVPINGSDADWGFTNNQIALGVTNPETAEAPLINSTYDNALGQAGGVVQPAYYNAGAANQAYAGQVANNASQVSPYLAQILQAGFDPQNALYNQTQQQVTDQTNASLAARGLNSSGVGAGIAAQNNNNFNIDWQNNQLGREQTALSGYATGANSANNQYNTAGSLQTAGAQDYNAGNQVTPSVLQQYLSTLQNGFNNTNAISANDLSYLGYSAPNSAALNANQNAFNNNVAQGQAIGQLGSQLANNPSLQAYLSSLFGSSNTGVGSGGGGFGGGAGAGYGGGGSSGYGSAYASDGSVAF